MRAAVYMRHCLRFHPFRPITPSSSFINGSGSRKFNFLKFIATHCGIASCMIQPKNKGDFRQDSHNFPLALFKNKGIIPDMKIVTKRKTEPRVRVTLTNATSPRLSRGFTVYGTTVDKLARLMREVIEPDTTKTQSKE